MNFTFICWWYASEISVWVMEIQLIACIQRASSFGRMNLRERGIWQRNTWAAYVYSERLLLSRSYFHFDIIKNTLTQSHWHAHGIDGWTRIHTILISFFRYRTSNITTIKKRVEQKKPCIETEEVSSVVFVFSGNFVGAKIGVEKITQIR